MDKDEMMRMIEQVAAQSEQDRERVEIEAYIDRVCSNARIMLRNEMHFGGTGIPEPTRTDTLRHKWRRFFLQPSDLPTCIAADE